MEALMLYNMFGLSCRRDVAEMFCRRVPRGGGARGGYTRGINTFMLSMFTPQGHKSTGCDFQSQPVRVTIARDWINIQTTILAQTPLHGVNVISRPELATMKKQRTYVSTVYRGGDQWVRYIDNFGTFTDLSMAGDLRFLFHVTVRGLAHTHLARVQSQPPLAGPKVVRAACWH